MSEHFNPETDYDPSELAALIEDVECPVSGCYGTCEVDVLQRYNKVKVWCSGCDRDLGDVARRRYKIPHDAPLLVRPTINITGAALEHADEYARALARAESPDHHVFVIGDTYSIVRADATVDALNKTALQVRFAEVAQSRTRRGYTDPPANMVAAIMEAAADQAAIPKLERVNTVPVFLYDGTLLDQPGYDAQSHTYYAPVVPGIKIPEMVTAADVADAVELLTVDYLGDVAFKGEADRANTMACMLLTFVRALITGPAPLHVFDAPSPGHGKTQTLACALLPGCGLVTPTKWAHSSEEQTKKLFAALRKAPNAMFIDNVTGVVDSETLEAILTTTSGYYTDRILSTSETETVPVHQTWTMSTNNGRMGKSMQRRAIWVRIDAAVEHPEYRAGPTPDTQWRHPEGMVEWGTEHRAKLVSGCLVLCRWWIQHDMPRPNNLHNVGGSYEQYKRVIGGILQLAGIDGLYGNALERDQNNEEHSDLAKMLHLLRDAFEGDRFTASDAFNRGLVEANGARGVGMILTHHVDEIAGGLVIRKHPTTRGGDRYSVQAVLVPD